MNPHATSSHGLGLRRVCRACGEMFVITRGEIEFFTLRGLRLPWRCGVCRRAARLAQSAESHGTK